MLIVDFKILVGRFKVFFKLYDILKKEWSIWSKCLGKLIIINGVSSTGKTTLSKYLEKFGFIRITFDEIQNNVSIEKQINNDYIQSLISELTTFMTKSDFSKVFLLQEINNLSFYNSYQIYKISQAQSVYLQILKNTYDMMYKIAKKFIYSGTNIIIDSVITSNKEIDLLYYCFNNYRMFFILLYLSLEDNLNYCRERNNFALEKNLDDFRKEEQVLEQYPIFYYFKEQYGVKISKNHFDTFDDNILILNSLPKFISECIVKEERLPVKPILKYDCIIDSLKLRKTLQSRCVL